MLTTAHELPDDIAELKAMVLASRAELHGRDLLIEKLKHQLAGLRRHQFGARSESLDQLELTLEAEEIAQAAEQPPATDDTAPQGSATVPDDTKGKPKRAPCRTICRATRRCCPPARLAPPVAAS